MSQQPYFVKFKNRLGKWKQAEVEAKSKAEAETLVKTQHEAMQIKSVVLIHRMGHKTTE